MATIKRLNKRLAELESELAQRQQGASNALFILVPDTAEFADVPRLSDRLAQMRLRADATVILIPDNGRGGIDRSAMVRDDPTGNAEG